MSHRATLYAKELRVCPNGELISKLEKLVLYALADYHQDRMGENTFPSVARLADESLMDERSCRRLLASLERKGVLSRERPTRQGCGHLTFYRFIDLDKKGGLTDPLFLSQKEGKRGAKGGQKGGTECTALDNGNLEQEQKQIQLTPQPPAAQGERADSAAELFLVSDQPSADAIVDQVMLGCGFTARRLRVKLLAVVKQRVGLGESPVDVSAAMVDKWQRYTKQGARLRVHMSAAKFFEEGYWLNPNSWHWDSDTLREEQLAMNASVGTRR